ncbi:MULTISPECIES: DoxX family protein [unclassified Variovorax]|uniref:DoxX family protein n=1 Tax=unclassified Variovorax TaxID=663243 RepID=UPI00257773D2|nr:MULTISPECIES: DoxX family protein [unclassified Variovorax]MDM0086135.1 DoxX family protein [Variovorax sp. J22G40]MDM0145608.1 DoxX family protein [Variovorax sp. J2P1-31]
MSTITTTRPTGVSTTGSQDVAALVGRILLAALFVPAGFGKLMGFAGTVGYIASVGLPVPQVAAVVAILVELGLGLALLVGFKTRWAAIGIALFTLVATFAFHNYWAMPADKAFVNQLMFFKNIAVVGGLLVVWAFGPGRLSIDKR